MTQKELAYVEDAIGHEGNIIKICDQTIKYLDDNNLISFMEQQKQSHIETKQKLMNMLEVKANE